MIARKLARKIKYSAWVLNGYIGKKYSLETPEKLTVLITYFNPIRMEHIDPQVRNILKCTFVETIIISNHNSTIQIESKAKVRDKRITFINQSTNRGCGFRWQIADTFNPEYLIVIDDDILLFPSQLTKLFVNLINEPEIPHGISGFLHLDNGEFEFHDKENLLVDYLCEVYAVTRQSLNRYLELERVLAKNASLSSMLESWADFMIISQTGSHSPKIHNVGRLFRCLTFKEPGVALHKAEGWHEYIVELSRSLDNLVEFDKSIIS